MTDVPAPRAPGAAVYLREVTLAYGPRRGPRRSTMTSSAEVTPFVRALIADRVVEHFVVVALDARQRPMAWTTIAIGSPTTCPVSPSDLLRFAILAGGPAFLVAHNHPSGDPSPSAQDLDLTKRLEEAARVVGLQLLDSIIVAEDGHYSFCDAGLLSGRSR